MCKIWWWVVHSAHQKNELQKSKSFSKVCAFFKWRGLKIKSLDWECEILASIFLKNCLFLSADMDSPPSIFTSNTKKFISIDWYSETSTFMLYAIVNATRNPQKAANWIGIKNGKWSKENKYSWYRSIDKRYFWVFVKFEDGLSIPFTRKMSSKKWDFFQGLSFV
jgi:hypothetical protein